MMFSSWIHFKLGDVDAAASEVALLLGWADRCGLDVFRALEGTRGNDPRVPGGRRNRRHRSHLRGPWCMAGGSRRTAGLLLFHGRRAGMAAMRPPAAELELEKARKVEEKTGEGYYKAEMQRLQGDIKWLHKSKFAEAGAELRTALDIATTQQSKTFRLRAAISLLKLARSQYRPSSP